MIFKILVWERSTGTHQPVGDMVCEVAGSGRTRAAFRYQPEYLSRPDAFALDPVSLPLGAETFTRSAHGIFGVFEDSLPDDWGRNLLVRRCSLARRDQSLPRLLLALGNTGLGALSYTDSATPPTGDAEVGMIHLSGLVDAAEQVERGATTDASVKLLLSAGSSPGGARPKALVWDKATGSHYLAKFPSVKDREDVVRIEAATMALAAKAGLDVPRTQLVTCAGKPVLLVERFDVTPFGRRHMVSFQTLLKAGGYYQQRYFELLKLVRKHSRDPLQDAGRLFRQMVFNAVVGNTDDHLKNFLMLHDHEHGWHLSPAFDLIPDVGRRGEHVLFFDWDARFPGRGKLVALGDSWGVGNARRIVDEVFDSVATWQEAFSDAGVPAEDRARFREIDTHLACTP
jgi:serine/threonine-protein kinase HipA